MLLDSVVEEVYAYRVFRGEGERILGELENITGFTVVPLLFGVRRYIDARTVDSIYTVLRDMEPVEKLGIVLVLFSGGGDVDEAYLPARHLQGLARERTRTNNSAQRSS